MKNILLFLTMGFCRQNIKALYLENEYRKIEGNFLCLGRQSVNISTNELESIFQKPFPLDKNSIDDVTKHARLSKDKRITDKFFLQNAFNVKYFSIDLNKYEDASINFDLNKEIPKKYENKFDFIFSGGLLDNLFNPSNALINISKMLKKNGRMLIWEPSRGLVGSMLNFTPEYFYSYFALNNFKDFKIYLLTHTNNKPKKKSQFDYFVDVFSYNPNFTRRNNFDYLKSSKLFNGIHYVMAVVEKGVNSTTNKIPVNLHYLPFVNIKNKKLIRWDKKKIQSRRKFIGKSNKRLFKIKKKIVSMPYDTDHYKYLCSDF
jgi:SAM-dependent methyltransferase